MLAGASLPDCVLSVFTFPTMNWKVIINSLDDGITDPRKKIIVRILISYYNMNI